MHICSRLSVLFRRLFANRKPDRIPPAPSWDQWHRHLTLFVSRSSVADVLSRTRNQGISVCNLLVPCDGTGAAPRTESRTQAHDSMLVGEKDTFGHAVSDPEATREGTPKGARHLGLLSSDTSHGLQSRRSLAPNPPHMQPIHTNDSISAAVGGEKNI